MNWRNKKFRVIVKGYNVLLRDVETGKVEQLGFFTTRFVKARDANAAIAKALALVADAVSAMKPLNASATEHRLKVEVVEEVNRIEEVEGFSFFPDTAN